MQRLSIVAVLQVALLLGCGNPYAGASQKSSEIATSLITISNQKSSDRLTQVEELISSSETAGELSSHEAGYLMDIVELGRSGDWESAEREAREVLSNQVAR